MKGFIVPNLDKARSRDCTVAAIRMMKQCGIEPVMCQSLRAEFGEQHITFTDEQTGLSTCDFIIAVGGDGTILHAAQDAVAYDLPVLGINAGRVGFLATLEEEEIHFIPRIAMGEYLVEERMLIEASVEGKSCWAVNDLVLTRGDYSRIVDIDIFCNDKSLYSVRGDGVILSTPTGSTAYAMSAGGPVVDPSIQAIGLSPICPYSLFSRTILISSKTRLTLCSSKEKNGGDLVLSADGREVLKVLAGQKIQIEKSDKVFKLIRFKEKDFYQVLNQKLMRGGDYQ